MSRLKNQFLPWLVLAAAVAAHLGLLAVRQSVPVVSGDEGTFVAMAESLARDGDLVFAEEDRNRLESAEEPGRRGVILQKTDRISYSKPALYPFLAAPWYLLAGELGMVLLNVGALAVALVLGFLVLRRAEGGERRAAWTLVTFTATGVLLSYVAWTMSDSLQASLTVAGLALCLAVTRPAPAGKGPLRRLDRFLDSPWAPALGGLLLGFVVAMRYPNALIAAAPVAALALTRRLRRAALAALLLLAGVAFGIGLNQWLGGAPVPYKTLRATFNPASGYPAGPGAEAVEEHWQEAKATQRMGLEPVDWEPRVSLYAALYYLVGRHTGLLVYFPAALVLAWAALRRRDAAGWILLAATAGMVVFYLGWMPRNYFGGATFVGNRYFLAGYAALLLAPRALPGRRSLVAVWGLSLVVYVSAMVSAVGHRGTHEPSQSHSYAGIFRWLPYETVAPALDGRRDRYWSDELVRFVDPHARVERDGFRLAAGEPPAELLIASGREHRWMRFLVQADRPDVEVVYRDWRRRLVVPLEPDGEGGSRGVLEVEAAVPWRRHAYWWDPATPLGVWAARLSLRGPEDASAELRYLGPYRFARKFYSAEPLAVELPRRGRAGNRREVPLRIRNSGWRPWATADSIPIHLSYRLRRGEDGAWRAGPLTRIEPPVASGGELATELRVRWPAAPGRYEMVVDLVVAGHLWFEEWGGGPVARSPVEILPEGAGGEATPPGAAPAPW